MVSAVSHATVAPVTHELNPKWTPEDWVRISTADHTDTESGVIY